MLAAILALFSLCWFCNSRFFVKWSKIIIGGDQISISVTALIIIIYIFVAVIAFVSWYYSRRKY